MYSALRLPRSARRGGFTLVEMLVTIGILLLLMTITLATVNISMDSDRIASGARSMQSFLEGARNRAIFAGRPRGIRLMTDPNNPTLVTSILYIEEPEPFPAEGGAPEGRITIAADGQTISGVPAMWTTLYNRGLLAKRAAAEVMIGVEPSYTFYTVRYDTGTGGWKLTRPYAGGAGTYDSIIYLEPVILPNQEPRTFASGIAIDLATSQLPATYAVGSGDPLDILFSPRGIVTGGLASGGTIHFRLVDLTDVNQTAADPTLGRDELLVTVRPQTGKVSSHPVDPRRDASGNEIDPFYYAELGEGTGP